MRRAAAALLALLLLAPSLGVSRAHASIEEFDSFDLSRMEAGDLRLQPQPLDLGALAGQAPAFPALQ